MERRSNNLRERMLSLIQGAKFRLMNEKMCKLPIKNIKKNFENNPTDFIEYHDSYKSLQTNWPEKPIDKLIESLKTRSKFKIIADMGCGNAQLAQSLPNKVHSFDLVSHNVNVIACNMSKVPLSAEAIDIVVFCLSLMGTNISPFIIEANRILKIKGLLIISELCNRFFNLRKFLSTMQQLGFQIIKQ
ncbi:unnamed protein product, partial [Gordionus sp. m RMFG-2023]